MTALLDMNTSPAEPETPAQAKPPMRFTYASGARPLDGYTIKRGVGRGGFGEVYFAVSDAGKEVALKLIRRNLEVELRGVTHCLNLKHPNLVALYDIRTDEHEDRWVVMEYVSGESLEDMIDRYPQGMPKEEAVHWFDGICAAVAYLHDHGIVHRDLKPANIFLDDGTIKIGDYGLSKFISCSRRSGQTESVGTVHYMAPEIANGRYGREIDAYALGIILYEMLTGRVPFEGESVGEVLMKHLTAEPQLDQLDEPFRTVVQGAMAKDPANRINSAAEMMAKLRSAAACGLANPSPAPSSAESAPAPFKSQPAPAKPQAAKPAGNGFLAFMHRDPEPVMSSLKLGAAKFREELQFSEWPIPWRIALGFVCTVGFFMLWPIWIGLIFVGTFSYFAYLFTRSIVRVSTDNPSATPARRADATALSAEPRPTAAHDTPAPFPSAPAKPPADTTPSRIWSRRHVASWRHAAYQELAARSTRQRASSLLGSMLAAGLIAPVAAFLVCLLAMPQLQPELLVWMSIVGVAASWAIMVAGQLAEGSVEDHMPLRFILLLAGALVGMFAWGVADYLYLQLPVMRDMAVSPGESLLLDLTDQDQGLMASYRSGAVQMSLPLYAGYFAFLFAVLRWWRMAESTRPTRVGLWAVAWCAFIAWGMTFFWWFPQPTGLLLAAVIAFTVQLSSPWLSPSRRRELAQKAVQYV
jgi:serine/threonine protein kinase